MLNMMRPETTSPICPSWIRWTVSLMRGVWRLCVPGMTPSFFSFAISPISMTLRTPTGSTATGFSKKTCFPASIAAVKCWGRNPGGWQSIT